MSGTGVTDWMDVGAFPLQDHDGGVQGDVPIHVRQTLVGCRVAKLADPDDGGGPKGSLLEYAREDGHGTLGDIHPWMFWQTADPDVRGMGSWSMAWAGMTMDGGEGGFGISTGHRVTASEVLPIHGGFEEDTIITTDTWFKVKKPAWPECFPTLPKGVMVMVMPTTEEGKQQELMLHTDPRLFAVNVSGPGEAGTLVCDLQPDSEPCMDDSKTPGFGGRHARLQSMIRVIAMDQTAPQSISRANALAWNLSRSSIDGLIGLGLCYAKLDMAAAGPPTGGPPLGRPITPGPGPPPGGFPPNPLASTFGGNGNTNGGTIAEGSTGDKSEVTPCSFGKFGATRQSDHGLAFMAFLGGGGPFHAGNASDKHRLGQDRDGHPINSGHIATGALFYRNQREDGALLFEGDYPKPPPLPLISKVHLTWDDAIQLWRWYAEYDVVVPKTKTPGKKLPPKKPTTPGRPGPSTPTTPGPSTPTTPGPRNPPGRPTTGGPGAPGPGAPRTPTSGGGPTTGGPGPTGPTTPSRGGWKPTAPPLGPTTPGPGLPPAPQAGPSPGAPPGIPTTGGPGVPPGPITPGPKPKSDDEKDEDEKTVVATTIDRVGGVGNDDVGLFLIHRPMMSSFGEMSFRPQLMVEGHISFTHNANMDAAEAAEDEEERPQVLAMRSWGGQNDSGEWSYLAQPDTSRARGGTAHGGILFSPPELEMEDYFGINSSTDLYSALTTSYVAVAPGVSFGLGTPTTDGGLNVKGIVIRQDPADLTNDALTIYQLDSTGASKELIGATLDQASDEVVITLGAGGNQAVVIPRGTTAQRQSALTPVGGELRINTDVIPRTPGEETDALEYRDGGLGAWRQLHSGTRLAAVVNGDGASLIGLEDAGEFYDATDVEAAFAELKVEMAVLPPAAITFTATSVFPFRHERGIRPSVQVIDAAGIQLEVCVTHTDVDTVVLNFVGTITSGILLLN